MDHKTKDDLLTESAERLIRGIFSPENNYRENVLNEWVDILHQIFLKRCPCQKKEPGKCLLQYDHEFLVNAFKNTDLNFDNFYKRITSVFDEFSVKNRNKADTSMLN